MKSKKAFLEEYKNSMYLQVAEKKGVTWEKLVKIYKDYRNHFFEKYSRQSKEMVERLYKNAPSEVRIIYGRAKDPDHLLEKIIRKIGKEDRANYAEINSSNYRSIITDLIGIRILVLKKEDWVVVDNHIKRKFKKQLQYPVAYVCYGDRDIYDPSRIRTDYTNRGYRSQHYIVKYKDVPCEIQVRTLAEEVYGEFDHKIRYPYRIDNKFLNRYNRIISKTASELDDLISTGSTLAEANVDGLSEVFEEDRYIDWQKKIEDPKKPVEELSAETGGREKQPSSEGALEFSKKYFITRKE